MPLYEYKCPKGCTYEKMQSFKGRAPRKCPECGHKNGQKRQVGTGVGLKFSGTGYYVTDYPKDKR